ncbi:MAG: two-component system response regulator, partial [Acidiphilium sp. 21-66-27]
MKLLIFGNPVDNRDILTTFFRSKLVVVDETSDLEEALDLTRFYEYDAVVLRVTDTRPAEIELIRRLHLSGLRCPILAVSQLLSEATRLRILEAGVDDLIVNAISHEETFLRVQNQVRRSRGFQSPSLAVGN